MKDVQDRLAELLKAGAGHPPARITVRAVRREAGTHRIATVVGTVAIVAVAAVVGTGLFGRFVLHAPSVSPTVSAPPVPCQPGWSVAKGAVPAGDRQDRLVAIAGSASDDIWAVGDRLPSPRQVFPLLEHWDGRRWTYSAGAPLGGRQATLTGVAAVSASDVWAIGSFASVGATPPAPLIEHWNGRSWSLQPTRALSRLTAPLPQTLTSIAALGPDDVWVLGHPSSSSSDAYLHWNGAAWQLFAGPNIGPRFGSWAMQNISYDHRAQLWAVGGWMRGIGEAAVPGGGTVERWNGRGWQVYRRAAWRAPLTMVAPAAPADVWAVAGGSFTTAGTYGVSPVQVLRWNGRGWQVALSLGTANSVDPTGLVAVSANDVYVIGQSVSTGRPFIRHWDGSQWRALPLGPGSPEFRNASLTPTVSGQIAALATEGIADRANALWLRCRP
jgi:hypothetical protein